MNYEYKPSTTDEFSGLPIRLTDNSPKDGDIYDEEFQTDEPLTEEEIRAIVEDNGYGDGWE